MSFVTHDTETRTSVDPWTGTTRTHEAITGWTCKCGAKWRRAKRGDTTYTQAAWHLINKHGAPTGLGSGDGCPCGYQHGDSIYGHAGHHEQWVVEVWDA